MVTRCSSPRQARDAELLHALKRTGYPGRIVPTRQATLRIQGLRSTATCDKVRASLRRVRGVRNVEIRGTQGAQVTFDPRRAKTEDLTRALRQAGIQAQLQG